MSHSQNMERFQEMLDEGSHCSQCVFRYWAERLDIDEEFAMRISSGLGMGVNHGDSCGAVTSTTLALGLVHGFSQGSESGKDGGVEDLTKEFEASFAERNGSLLCRDLLSGGYDAADPDAVIPEDVDPWENCAKYCADAVELAEQYLGVGDLERYVSEASLPGGEWEGLPSPTVVAVGSGMTGLALGALAAAIVTYERRRAKNERA